MATNPIDHIALEQLQLLRQRLREALYAKKARMRELADLCKREQIALRNWVAERKQSALGALREDARRARAAAKVRRSELLAEARRSTSSAVEVARRAVEIEQAHAAEQLRITRAHQAERTHIGRAHVRAVNQDQTPSSAMLQRLRPMLEKAGAIRPAAGESRTEALWRYARTHPEEMHALLEPKAEWHIAQTREQIAAVESSLRTGMAGKPTGARRSAAPQPSLSAVRAKAPRKTRARSSAAAKAKAAPDAASRASAPAKLSARERKAPTEVGRAPAASPPKSGAEQTAPLASSGASPPTPRAPNPYEQKRASRIERQRGKAGKLRAEAAAAHGRARAIGDAIPMGQPILIGHHSQRRHERDLAKMDASMRKSVELSAAADTLERRAARAEKHPAISSDDPEAVAKLRAKLAELDKQRETMRAANKTIRGGGDVVGGLTALGFSEERAKKLLVRDPLGNIGFPDYAFRNAAGERARLLARIEDLERRATTPARPDERIGGAVVSEQENRVRVSFPCVPPEAIRKQLKGAGFRWSPTASAWQRMTSNAAWAEARRILSAFAGAAMSRASSE
jgi:hypothetical protein